MLVYLRQAIEWRGPGITSAQLLEALDEGAVQRVRPKSMTVAVIVTGLAPLLISS
jgi:Cu(I)/Ag(I) efflux system membrane protein CusA/SilA